jgi:hypothetical protein
MNALEPLLHRYHLAKRAHWTSLAEVRKDFRHADVVGVFTVFNIAGNKYRLIRHDQIPMAGGLHPEYPHPCGIRQGEVEVMSSAPIDERKYQRLLGEALPVMVRTEREYWRLLRSTEQLMERPEETITEEEGRLLELLSVLDRGIRRSYASSAEGTASQDVGLSAGGQGHETQRSLDHAAQKPGVGDPQREARHQQVTGKGVGESFAHACRCVSLIYLSALQFGPDIR